MYDGWYFLAEVWQRATPAMRGCLALLVFMFVWVVITGTERFATFWLAARQTRNFLGVFPSWPASNDKRRAPGFFDKRMQLQSHATKLFGDRFHEFLRHGASVPTQWSVEMEKRTARISANLLHEKLREGLSTMGTIASTAPLVGFFGSILGIENSFPGISMNKAFVLATTANRVAEALVCSAAGVLVAVPAVWCYNWQRDHLAQFDSEIEFRRFEFLKHPEQQSGGPGFQNPVRS